jgi:hypothetical protein
VFKTSASLLDALLGGSIPGARTPVAGLSLLGRKARGVPDVKTDPVKYHKSLINNYLRKQSRFAGLSIQLQLL